MKFSHALKFNANSAWKDHYINYNRLKKLIYKKEAEETQGMSLNMPDIANRTSIGMMPSSTFLSPFSALFTLHCLLRLPVGQSSNLTCYSQPPKT